MDFFKGYVKTKNKQCIEKFKNRTDFKTYDQIKDEPEFAGILAENTILIDVDDSIQSEMLMDIIEALNINCRVYKTTRGKHFLFRNNGIEKCYTHTKLAVGLTADIKVGCKNSYEVLKFDNRERFVEWEEEGDADVLPKWLIPVKTSSEFLTMTDGDGRNQALFNYILTLQASGMTVEEARECIGILNRYILKDPLDESELDVILRDEAFNKPVFFKGNVFLFEEFAMFLKNHHHIKQVNGQLHIYKDGIYVAGYQTIEASMIKHIPRLNRSKRTEVIEYLKLLCEENETPSPPHLIAFNNGVYDVINDCLMDFSPDMIFTNRIPWNYDPNAYYQLTDTILNNISVNDKTIRALIEEMIGSCFYRSNNLAGGKAFILTGQGANGKSTLLDMVRKCLGNVNVSVLDLKKINDRFSTVMLFNKLANIGDDLSDEWVNDGADFKKVVTGQSIDAEQKGQPKFNFEPYCKLLFSANNIPRIGKGRDSTAIMRRLVIVPFKAHFSPSDPDYKPFIGEELSCAESMEYLIKIGLQGLKRVLETKTYSSNEETEAELTEFEETNNPVLGFFRDDAENPIVNDATSTVFKRYYEWCMINNVNPMSAGEFSKQVKRHFGLKISVKKINGKSIRVFTEV